MRTRTMSRPGSWKGVCVCAPTHLQMSSHHNSGSSSWMRQKRVFWFLRKSWTTALTTWSSSWRACSRRPRPSTISVKRLRREAKSATRRRNRAVRVTQTRIQTSFYPSRVGTCVDSAEVALLCVRAAELGASRFHVCAGRGVSECTWNTNGPIYC